MIDGGRREHGDSWCGGEMTTRTTMASTVMVIVSMMMLTDTVTMATAGAMTVDVSLATGALGDDGLQDVFHPEPTTVEQLMRQ